MASMESAASSQRPTRPRAITRDPERRLIAGVCAGIGRYFRIHPLWIRFVFVAATAAGGFGVVVYLLAWALMPAEAGVEPRKLPWSGRRASIEVGVGAGLLLLALLLGLRATGIWFSDAIVWPLVLVAAGAALLWRQSLGDSTEADAPAVSRPETRDSIPAADTGSRISRTGLGVALVIAAGLVFLKATGSLSAARDVVLAVLVVAVGLSVIFAPLIARLIRSLSAERAERIRSQERAELGAHLHDSVLQTLALMQKRADNPREVAALARRQERELRTWLSRGTASPDERPLATALDAAADEIEREYRVPIDVVAVGDAPLDAAGEAAVAAAREAMLNAAKFGGGSPVDVYAESRDGRIEIFVRDRGPGFDPASIPEDRRGVRESIIGRMERHGGHATIRPAEGGGTEVELTLEREDK
jgi:signal transduction histidine kinase